MIRRVVAAILLSLLPVAACTAAPQSPGAPLAPVPGVHQTSALPASAAGETGVLVVPASNSVTGTYPAHCTARGPLPDPVCTPGSIRSDVDPKHLERTVCRPSAPDQPSWAFTIRPKSGETGALKTVAMRAYGVAPSLRSRTELDHKVMEALGGSNDVTNFWAEVSTHPTGFRNDKDTVEDHALAEVCRHRADPAAMEHVWVLAVRSMATDWTTTEHVLGIDGPKPVHR
jgi:hypothetical protein